MRFFKTTDKTKPYSPTSEEFFIERYFYQRSIKYIVQYKTPKLVDDDKAYRIVDFYLPKYGVYVEYFGMYNSTKEIRANYDEKVRVYIKSNLPTVIIYPHELGFLDYAFNTKMLKVLRLEKFKSTTNLFKYKIKRYMYNGKSQYFFLSLLFFAISYGFFSLEKEEIDGSDFIIMFSSGYLSIYLIVHFIFNLIDTFYYDE